MQQFKIWLSPPHMGGDELKYVLEAFETNWISPAGPHITAFENELAAYCGTGHCAALSSGTAAIHLALLMLGVQRGDEVISPSFTFAGSCNPITYIGATPVFVDSEPETWNMDPVLMEEAIIDRLKRTGKVPKAIILVHLYGMPAKISQITEVAGKFNIPIIEDAAEALGSRYNNQMVGTFGKLGVLSFNGNKIITTSGGGALISKDAALISRARFLATQARDPAPHYQHSEIGYNYRLSNVCAGIGRGQLKVIEDRVGQRRSIFRKYQSGLSNCLGIKFVDEPSESRSNRWLTTVLIDNTENQSLTSEIVRKSLEQEGIESRPLWKPMHLQPVFEYAPSYVNGTSEALFDQGLCLPSGSAMTDEALTSVITKIRTTAGY